MNRVNKAIRSCAVATLGCMLVLGGCNTRPETPKTKWYGKSIQVLEVNPGDAGEVAAVTAVEVARSRYHAALVGLAEYYNSIGNVQKGLWASRELRNLDEAQEFTWGGVSLPGPPSTQPAGKEPKETTLVENVVNARIKYRKAVDQLAKYYEKKGESFKAYVIHTIQGRFHPEETFLYLFRVQLPPRNLEPVEIIPKANELYDRAVKLYRQGSGVPAAADYPKQRRALQMFLRLVRQYPRSTRIALAAFYIGEIYKEYFREHYLAVLWYERALMWDPYVPMPVRFQTAVQYDFNLDDKTKALDLYKASLKLEPFYSDNVRYAKQRIGELEDMLKYRGAPRHEEPVEAPKQETPVKEPKKDKAG